MDKEMSTSFADLKNISGYSKLNSKISGIFFDIAKHEDNILKDIWPLFNAINRLNREHNSPDEISSKKLFDIYFMLCKEIESSKEKSNSNETLCKNKIAIIDKYMRMFFDSIIFTEIALPKFPLVSKVEQDIIGSLLGIGQYTFPEVVKSINLMNEDIVKLTSEISETQEEGSKSIKASELAFNYKAKLQMKQRFMKITHIGLMRYQEHDFIMAFDFSEINHSEKLKAKSSLMKISLLIASGALLRKHNGGAN